MMPPVLPLMPKLRIVHPIERCPVCLRNEHRNRGLHGWIDEEGVARICRCPVCRREPSAG